MDFYGLKTIDVAVIVGYFAAVMAVGFWVSRRVKNETDYFLGGRRFGKGLLVMHWLCTGTHSEMAVQVAGAGARVGIGGIWYQWMWMFSTPFYWFIAPVMRRLRVITTGDFFRVRYGRSAEILYCGVAAVYFMLSISSLLRGAGAAIAGATGGEIPTETSVAILCVLFSTYIMAGGLIAAAYTDALQGVLIIVLSFLLVPAGLAVIGGLEGLHDGLPAAMFSVTAPEDAKEGHVGFVVAMSVLGLVGIVAQPHVMTATGSGKSETEARVGMTYGNFIKRVLTVAWVFTGMIALVKFPDLLAGVADADRKEVSEQLFGRAVREFLGDGWRGLMIACLIAGVTSAETIMVVGSAIFTRNVYEPAMPGKSPRHYLWVGRLAAAAILFGSMWMAFRADSVTDLFVTSVKVIGLLGAAFWLGVTWRRANVAGVWASFVAGLATWVTVSLEAKDVKGVPFLEPVVATAAGWFESHGLRQWSDPVEIFLVLAAEFGALILVGLLSQPHSKAQLDPFFARLLTPVGKEGDVRLVAAPTDQPETATLGLDGRAFDFEKAKTFGYAGLRRLGIEVPRMTRFDWGGFLAAWLLVAALVGGLVVLAHWR